METERRGPSRERLPITPSVLMKLKEVWDPLSRDPDIAMI